MRRDELTAIAIARLRVPWFGAAAAVLLTALTTRVLFALAVGGTYDYDEFVLCSGRDFAHGATPYSDFYFFHPPGMLVYLRAIEPLTSLWWPAARVAMLLLDSVTALLVYRVASRAFDRRAGMAAGLRLRCSPRSLWSPPAGLDRTRFSPF